ncbi:hypothetical protein H0H87_011759 [Tephrocybe sp. NHM501043]|nr:hypothetical protein H0H87_011759 [Tephrocybe sp. NHM501043]
MNKNPFVPQPSFTPQQPPLPPGPPPPQPAQPDYSAYWAAAAAHHQQPPAGTPYTPQWTAPQPQAQPPRPTAEQSALYANYGYGAQWQRQQQQQQLQQMQAQYHHPPPPPVAQPPPQPQVQPGYNPYQPTAGYPQPYVPQTTAAPQQMAPVPYSHQQVQQPQQFFQPHLQPPPPQQQQQQQQQQRHHIHHTPPQHLPPAKRQRFDGPNSNRQPNHAPPPQPQFQAPPPPPPQNLGPYTGPSGPARGGAPQGMNHVALGPARGGMAGGRGGLAGGPRGGRGAPMTGPRGGMAGGRGRGGGSFIGGGGGGGGGRGGGSSNSLRGHGSRGNFGGGNKDYQNRRGGLSGQGPYNQSGGSFRGGRGGQHQGPNRPRHDASFNSRDGQSSFGSAGKKDENRRTLTDFKIVGLEIRGLSWTWGSLPPTTPAKIESVEDEVPEPADRASQASTVTVKEETMDDEVPSTQDEIQTQPETQPPTQVDEHTDTESIAGDTSSVVAPEASTSTLPEIHLPAPPHFPPDANAHTPPPSRIRIYFHTPATADDARPIPHNVSPSFSLGATPSDSRKGKRKKLEDDDGDLEEQRTRPPPPQMRAMSADRSSVAPSVAHTEAASEDWLMAAIVGGEEEQDGHAHGAENDTADDEERLRASVNTKHEDHEDHANDSALQSQPQTQPADDITVADPLNNSESALPHIFMKHYFGVESLPFWDGRRCAHTTNISLSLKGMRGDIHMLTPEGGATHELAPDTGAEDTKSSSDVPAVVESNRFHTPECDATASATAPESAVDLNHIVAGADGDAAHAVPVDLGSAIAVPPVSCDSSSSALDNESASPPAPPSSAPPVLVSLPPVAAADSIASSQHPSLVSSVGEQNADTDADHVALLETQIPDPSSVASAIKSLLAVSAESMLLNVSDHSTHLPPPSGDGATPTVNGIEHDHGTKHEETQTQVDDFDNATQEMDHLPEPPASPPTSNTLLSTSSTSTYGGSPTAPVAKPEIKTGRIPSANRLSISYAGGNRRLVVDAEAVESLKLFRQEGRIEVLVNVAKEGDDGLRGILVEGLSDLTKSYLPLQTICDDTDGDDTLPPFSKAIIPSSLTLRVYLDTARPLSEPKWAKSGDIQEWLKSMFGRMFWVAGDAAEGWEKKLQVVDPDPVRTTFQDKNEKGWATNSPAGVLNERQRFLKTHMTETDNILEILLRLVRGERATASYQNQPAISAPSISGPLLSALSQGSAHGAQQTHVSLAVLAMFRMAVEYAQKAVGDKGKVEVEERMGEIIRCLPSHLVYKSLDGIFKEWRVEKKGR